MTDSAKLKKLYPKLTARERAILVLRAWNEGKEEAPEVRGTMPEAQVREFNRYIDLMNQAAKLSAYIGGLKALVGQLAIRWAWLATLDLWAEQAWKLGGYIFFHAREPITESEYAERLAAVSKEMVPVDEFAELLTERHEAWDHEDYAGEDGDGEPLVSDEAWERVVGVKRKELARLVSEGTLEGKGRGRRLRVQAASFYGWLGEDVPVWPDWSQGYDVRPDAEADKVKAERKDREQAREALAASPSIGRVMRETNPKTKLPRSFGDEIAEALEKGLRAAWDQRWQELRAAEIVLDEVAGEFDGEDPLEPDSRQMLVEARAELEELHSDMGKRLGGLTRKDEPEEGFIRPLREAVFG